jgi:hypothetical protein
MYRNLGRKTGATLLCALILLVVLIGAAFAWQATGYRAAREKSIPASELFEATGSRDWIEVGSNRKVRLAGTIQHFDNKPDDDPLRDTGGFVIYEVGGRVIYQFTGALAFSGNGIGMAWYEDPSTLMADAACIRRTKDASGVYRVERDASGRDVIYTVALTIKPTGVTVDAPGLPDGELRYTGYGSDKDAFVYFEDEKGKRLAMQVVSPNN